MKKLISISCVLFSVLLASGLLVRGDDKTPSANSNWEVLAGGWKCQNGVLSQSKSDTPALLTFGDPAWKDCTIEVEAQKTGGDEGFLLALRVTSDSKLIWLNVGGWGNTKTAFEGIYDGNKNDFGDKQTYSDFVAIDDKWHTLKVTVKGNDIEGFVDGKSACKATMDDGLATGCAALGTWSTQANFRNIKVTGADGTVLFQGLPSIGK